MKVLITGYSGFVGNALVAKALDQFDVSLLGRAKSDLATTHIAALDGKAVYQDALLDVSTVIHCAAISSETNIDPSYNGDQLNEVNVEATINLARQAVKSNVSKFIFLSSVKVNGEATDQSQFSETSEYNPQDNYGKSKARAEVELLKIAKESKMELVIIRSPLVYGSGAKGNFAQLIKLVKKLPFNPFIAIKSNKRSMVFVDNLVDLILKCVVHENAKNKIFMVSDGADPSTSELINKIAAALNKKQIKLYIPNLIFNIIGKITNKSEMVARLTGSLQVDISSTEKLLQWKPPYSFEEGIFMTINKSDNTEIK